MKKIYLYLTILILVLTGIFIIQNKNDVVPNNDYNDLVVNVLNGNNEIRLTSKRMSATAHSSDTVVVSATVNPSHAINKKLNWTLIWQGLEDEDFVEDPADYVGMVISENTLSVTLTYKELFEYPLLLTATSQADSSISASCTLNCYQRTYDMITTLGFNNAYSVEINQTHAAGSYLFDFSEVFSYEDIAADNDFSIDVQQQKKGTVSSLTNFTYAISFSAEVFDLISDADLSFEVSDVFYEFDKESGTNVSSLTFNQIFNGLIVNCTSDKIEELCSKVLINTNYWFDLDIRIVDHNAVDLINEFTRTYCLIGFDISDNYKVESVVLDNSNIIF